MSLQTVKTKYGVISGVQEQGYTIFKGVPYAKPPVGDLRLRAPQEPDCWEGVKIADKFANCSVQGPNDGEGFYGKEFYADATYRYASSEDCLYLNIWTPSNNGTEKLPVAFWIHGGGFGGGNGGEIEFDGKAFCSHDTILVTINYRLGLLGFMAHPWLTEESEQKISGNYGILDQIAALKWVYENIEAFGGDPENITVFGQSAGAMSVQTLVSSPLTKGMIKRAIIQSGGGYKGSFLSDKTLEVAEQQGLEFMALGQISSLEELRSIPAEQFLQITTIYLMALFQKMKEGGEVKLELPIAPIIDGYVLIDGYEKSIEEGMLAEIPYMIGSCRNDIVKPVDEENNPDAYKLMDGSVNFAHKLEETGNPDVYVYRFDRQLPGDDAGAFHSSELWYMFGTLDKCWRPLVEEDFKLSEDMVTYWTNFCKTGNPNGITVSEWKPCKKDNPFVMMFDVTDEV